MFLKLDYTNSNHNSKLNNYSINSGDRSKNKSLTPGRFIANTENRKNEFPNYNIKYVMKKNEDLNAGGTPNNNNNIQSTTRFNKQHSNSMSLNNQINNFQTNNNPVSRMSMGNNSNKSGANNFINTSTTSSQGNVVQPKLKSDYFINKFINTSGK